MKFNINLNQPLMIEHNLNVTLWCVLDVISVAPTWCDPVIKGKEIYFWIARQKIAEELKSLDLKPDTIYRNIKKLVELGFLEHEKLGKKDLLRLSKKGKNLFTAMSDLNPNNYVGNKSENNSDTNPTYNYTNTNNYTNNKSKQKESILDQVNEIFSELETNNPLNIKSYQEWIEDLKERKQGLTKGAIKKQLKMLCNYSQEVQCQIIDKSIQNRYKGLFAPKESNYAYTNNNTQNSTADKVNNYFDKRNNSNENIIDGEVS